MIKLSETLTTGEAEEKLCLFELCTVLSQVTMHLKLLPN
jgi:hypothetical protein